MPRNIILYTGAAVLASALAVGAQSRIEDRIGISIPGVSQQDQARFQNDEGRVTVEERYLYPLVDEAQQYFVNTVSFINRGDNHRASLELAKGWGMIGLQSARATGQPQRELDNTLNEIRQHMTDLGNNRNVRTETLKPLFAQANMTLAQMYQEQAREQVAANAPQRAGNNLHAAARSLEHAAGWSDQRLSRREQQTLDDAETLASRIQTSGQIADQGRVNEVLRDLNQSLNNLQRDMAQD